MQLLLPERAIGDPEDCRGVHGHEGADTGWRDQLAAAGGFDRGPSTHHCSRRGGAEAHEHFGLDHPELLVEPWPARLDLVLAGLVVDSALAALLALPLEVLYCVRDVDAAPVEARPLERLVEEATGGPHEGTAREVFVVAGLLAHEDHACRCAPLAEHGLGGALVEIAGGA